MGGETFGWAIKQLQNGSQVHREGWNGKGMFLTLIRGKEWIQTDERLNGYENLPFIAMKTADNKLVPWLASQTDMLAVDWYAL